MEHAQLVPLVRRLVIDVLDLEAAGRGVEQPPDDPVLRVEELALGELGGRRLRLGLDVQVDALLGGDLGVPLRGLLQAVDGEQPRPGARGLRLGQRPRRQGLRLLALGGPPGPQLRERRPRLLRHGPGPRPDRRLARAVVLLPQPVLQAVVAVAGGAVHAGHERRPHRRLAPRVGAGLRLRQCVSHSLALAGRGACQLSLAAARGPGARVGAPVRVLGSVVEAEGLLAALAEERQEVELVAVLELAVLADQRRVVAFSVHFDVACVGLGWLVRVRWC